MSHTRKPLALLVGAAVAAGSAFSMEAMAHGYMQDPAKTDAARHDHEGSCGMARMDTDKDGRISRTEFAAAHAGKADKFAEHDGDGDGFITQAEMDSHHAGKDAGKAKPAAKADGEMKCGEGMCGGKT
ncbi:MAG: hypothetical protein EOP93_13475 [Lysobacteraceae bacterium]|nr:MAG: hypothetical protein EOP93_13475 [Xanthomonadaceae bacterium]